MSLDPDILDDLFHACALAAFLELSFLRGGWPESEEVRKLAYRIYEDRLDEKNATKQPSKEAV